MKKKILYGLGITLLLLGTGAIVGWIGFQEHFRLLAQSLQQEMRSDSVPSEKPADESMTKHPDTVETLAEAELLMTSLETQLETLGSDDLPLE